MVSASATHARPSKDCLAWIESPMPLEIIMRVVPTPTTTEFLACTPSFISYACPPDGQAHRLLSRPACLYHPGSVPTAELYSIRPRSAFLPNYRGRLLTAEPHLSTPVDAHPSTPYPLSRLGHDKIMDLDYFIRQIRM